MADTVNVQTVYAGRRVITHLTNESDGGGESGVGRNRAVVDPAVNHI